MRRCGHWISSRERIEYELHMSGAAAVHVVKLSCDQVDKGHSTKGFGALRTSVFQSGKTMKAPLPLCNPIPLGERLVDRGDFEQLYTNPVPGSVLPRAFLFLGSMEYSVAHSRRPQ